MNPKTKSDPCKTASKKTFRSALRHFLKKNVPSLAGDLICGPVVDKVIEMADYYLPATEHLRPGQTLWYAIDKRETSGYGKKIEDCAISPVLVDLITEQDIEDCIQKISKRERQKKVAVRLHRQAYEQGGVFSYGDSASIMRLSPSTIGSYIREYEKETGGIVPRRGNVHDMGPTLTHKKIICIKHLMEGKSVEVTARETNHSPEAVTRYTNDFRRVQVCLKEGWELGKIKQATGLSESLAKQYIDIMEKNDNLKDVDLHEMPF
jgi:hypothetical protein